MNRLALQTFGFQSLPDENALRTRYRELLFENHPDHCPGDRSNRQTRRIIEAYQVLINQIRNGGDRGAAAPSRAEQTRQPGFQLLRGSFGNVAIPLHAVEGFVRARDTVIRNEHFQAIARHGGVAYLLFSPGGKKVSSRATIQWLLLLRTEQRGALAFRTTPEINFIVPERETLSFREERGTRSLFVGGLSYSVPSVPGIEF